MSSWWPMMYLSSTCSRSLRCVNDELRHACNSAAAAVRHGAYAAAEQRLMWHVVDGQQSSTDPCLLPCSMMPVSCGETKPITYLGGNLCLQYDVFHLQLEYQHRAWLQQPKYKSVQSTTMWQYTLLQVVMLQLYAVKMCSEWLIAVTSSGVMAFA